MVRSKTVIALQDSLGHGN